MTQSGLLRQVAEARKTVQELARLHPSCFDSEGHPIVASAHLPMPMQRKSNDRPRNS
jgi:hypothetical protein